jgi:hypothetical protein
MAVPFTPKGYMDLQLAVSAVARARNPELFSPETAVTAWGDWPDAMATGLTSRFLELKRKRHSVPVPDLPPSLASPTPRWSRPPERVNRPMMNVWPRVVPLSPEEEAEWVELEKRCQAWQARMKEYERNLVAARRAGALELRQALGDGDLQAFVISEGQLVPCRVEGWRQSLGLRLLECDVLPGQLGDHGEPRWGVLLPVAAFERWLAGPTKKRAGRIQVPRERLLAWLVKWCEGELQRTGFPPKRDVAVKALQDEMNCDREAALAAQKQLPSHLRRSIGKPPCKNGKGNRQ